MLKAEYLVALTGGAMIGLSASGMLLSIGRVMGVSGIIGGLLTPKRGEILWRLLFFLGLLIGGGIFSLTTEFQFSPPTGRGLPAVILGGLFVGFGTAMGSGCTSGHGVCGISRLSPRSIAATLAFMLSGILTVLLIERFL